LLATGVILLAASYEGALTLFRAGSFRDTNVDAFGRWVLGLTSLDGLHRSVLYTPQHLFSYSLLVLLLLLLLRDEPRDRPGAILLGALLALFLLRRGSGLRRFDREVAALAALALLAVLFLDLKGYEGVWMAWRAGSVLLLALGILAAPALGSSLRAHHALLLAPASLTVALDVWNAQDVSNRDLSAGDFRWTTVVSRDEWEALRWIREKTPEDSLVQWDVRARELGESALLPAIGERRMAVGSPIFLLDLRKYRARERREVRPIFASGDPEEAYRLATALGIDYLFLGARELQTRGERLRKLFESEERFRTVFSNPGVTILAAVPR
jgi:hypothetical protein